MTIGSDYAEWKRRALEAEARAVRAESLLLDALKFNNEGQKAAQLAQEDASGLASLLQDSQAMRRALRARAEQAERERDWANGQVEGVRAVLADERSARERAEADNAALLNGYLRMMNVLENWARDIETGVNVRSVEARTAADALRRIHALPHPGAALFAEVEALRRVNEATRPLLEWCKRPWDGLVPETFQKLADACAAVDALKEKP